MSATHSSSHSLTNARSEGRQMTSKGSFKTTLRRRAARIALSLTAIGAAIGVAAPAASAFELESAGGRYTDGNGAMARQVGSRADILNSFSVGMVPGVEPVEVAEMIHRIKFEQPPGLIANAVDITQCPETGLKAGANGNQAICPVGSQIGLASVAGAGLAPIYNVRTPQGMPALFAFNFLGSVIRLSPTVRPGDYGITMDSGVISQALMLQGVDITFWGVPADPVHDASRWILNAKGTGMFPGGPSPDVANPLPFTTLPTSCPGTAAVTNVTADGWDSQELFISAPFDKDLDGEPFVFSGCDQLTFEPTVQARPTTNVADSPSGLDVSIKIPQNEDPDGFAAAHLKDATMVFPAGMTVNPASADGLGACTPAQVGLTTPVGQPKALFDGAEAQCPNSSKLGTVQIDTPLLDHPMPGAIYLATQNQNPFGSLLALYIAIDDPQSGIRIKLAGQPKPDPVTGQLTVSFDNNPELPFTEFKVNLFTGPRAALKTPLSCGSFTTNTTMTPWTAPFGASVPGSDSFAITKGANGACVNADSQAPNAPTFSAGTLDPTAGAYSPFVLKVAREDGSQPIKAIDATLPKGLLGKLAGIPYCPDAALVVAAAKSGKAERAAPSCSPTSRVGSVNVSAGAGSTPLQVPGTAYLAGPYKGAPLSLAIVTPAVAGPFDLGTVVVRTALNIDPETTQIRAVSDPIPTILQGIPLDIRSIALSMDRPSFTLNPTSCDPTSVLGSATSVFGHAALLTDRFQVGGCRGLGFKPALAMHLKGGTARSKFPALRAELTARPGDANIAKAVVSLPHSEFLAQEHIRTVCTRVQFAANACPAGSIYGKATAWSPLLDQPLTGPVYLRSSSNPLPDLVADLNGQIRVSLVGRIDSIRGGIRNSFELVPDAPVTKFVLEMQGGKKGLLVNSRNLCKSVNRVDARFTAQNGTTHKIEPVLTNSCKKKARKSASHKRTANG